MRSPSDIFLIGLALVAVPLLVRGFLRRGRNLLERQELLPGERVLGDHDVELAWMPRRRAVVTTLAFMRCRARVTTERVILAQPALFAKETRVVRFVVLRGGAAESSWSNGFGTFVVDVERSGFAERGGARELRLAARDDAPILPAFVVVRGAGMESVANALDVGEKSARVG